MTQALYRKWRPQTFDEVVGQEHVTQTLRNALAAGRVGHAYLFAGPRGTGKTTMARLLAKAVNCLADDPAARPCNACGVCQAVAGGRLLDLIEIDAASHTSVDDVRELRDKIGFRPNECRYKVYIIDEVHRFSGSAFDALLKTIEEPPEHAIFILATTEIHKVPETILSRCQRFDFRRIPLQQIVKRLQGLVKAEGYSVEPAALALIARSATGSLRDAESLLDQLAATDGAGITLAQVQATLGTIDAQLVAGLVDSLVARDVAAGLALINQALDQGADLRQFTRQIVDHLRGMLLIKLQGTALLDLDAESLQTLTVQAGQIGTPELLQAIKRFNQAEAELRGGWQPQLPLELALVEVIAEQGEEMAKPPVTAPPAAPMREAPGGYSTAAGGGGGDVPHALMSALGEPGPLAQGQVAAAEELSLQAVQRCWLQVLEEVKTRDQSVQALLNSARPVNVRAGTVTLQVAHAFTQAKLSEARARRLVAEVLSQVLGQSCRVEYEIVNSPTEASPPGDWQAGARDAWADDPVVRVAREMGAEVRPINEGSET
jgi:DNA polymerase-3 subunit gamma/tau